MKKVFNGMHRVSGSAEGAAMPVAWTECGEVRAWHEYVCHKA